MSRGLAFVACLAAFLHSGSVVLDAALLWARRMI